MFEQKNNQPASAASPSLSPQREIITMPSEFLVKATPSSKPLFMALGGIVLLLVVGAGVVVVVTMSLPSSTVPLDTPPSPSAEESIPPEPQDTRVEPPVVEEPVVPAIVSVSPVGAEDADSDGLTNSEEEIFKTEPQNPDTDGDSYNDGDEVKNLFDPTKGSGALLKDSGTMTLFTEPALQWSVWVPSLWVITQGEISGNTRIATAFPDAFDITHQENPQRMPLHAWLSATQEGSTPSSLVTTRSGATVLWNADSLGAYIAKPLTDMVYRVTYNKGVSDKQYFPAIFRMMVENMILP